MSVWTTDSLAASLWSMTSRTCCCPVWPLCPTTFCLFLEPSINLVAWQVCCAEHPLGCLDACMQWTLAIYNEPIADSGEFSEHNLLFSRCFYWYARPTRYQPPQSQGLTARRRRTSRHQPPYSHSRWLKRYHLLLEGCSLPPTFLQPGVVTIPPLICSLWCHRPRHIGMKCGCDCALQTYILWDIDLGSWWQVAPGRSYRQAMVSGREVSE